MKRRLAALATAGALLLTPVACQDWLDVNTNPNAPETVAPNLYISPMLHWMVTGEQLDGRCDGSFSQEFITTTRSTNTLMGRNFSTADPCAEQWRDVYWNDGQNLIDMMNLAQAQKRWDILGLGYVIKAWGWQTLVDQNGPIIIKEAFGKTPGTFHYDTEEFVYEEVRRNLDSAFVYLGRSDDAVDPTYMAVGDKMYNGDHTKWLKFAHALYAINLNHYAPNKAAYKPDSVIYHVDQSLASNADDALWSYPGTNNDDRNWLGPTRNNYNTYRQTQFVVALLDGTDFGAKDPRLSRILVPAPDSQYRGLDPNSSDSFTPLPAAQRPLNPYRYVTTPPAGSPGLYVWSDKAKVPAITYAEMQFIKAEAAYYKGDAATALLAYKNGISSSIDFVNDRNRDDNQQATQISSTEKAAFLADPRIVPASATALTLTQIMSQKYIALWGWGHNEIWMDMRRYHYTDVDPKTGQSVYPRFQIPTTLAAENNGKPIYRLLPRYNSEYVWNQAGLSAIGALDLDYHTRPLWIVTPDK